MKKILALFAVLLVAIMVFACGKTETTGTSSTTATTKVSTTSASTTVASTTAASTTAASTTAASTTAASTTAASTTAASTTAASTTAATTTAVTTGVVVDLDFDSITDGVIKDNSGNGNDAKLTGNATVADGKITFAEKNTYLTIKNDPSFCFAAADSFTLEITFAAADNLQEFHSWPTLLSMGDKNHGWFGIWAPANGFQWGGDLIDPADNSTNIPVGPIDTAEHTLTVIQNGTEGKIYIYFDSVLVKEAGAINHSSTGDLFIGGGTYSGNGKFDTFSVQQFKGTVSEFKIWNYATEAPKAPENPVDPDPVDPDPVDPDPVDPDPKHEDLYVDINFAGNTATDAEGNVDFVVKGDASKVTTGEFTVKYGTKDVTVTGINIKSGAWVLGTFNKLDDNTAVDAAVANAGGFTVEAFYANIDPTGFVGIVCATEGNAASVNKAKQGWGLADNATAPYFITGNGAWCSTNPSGANITAGTLVHVVGVYDDAADKIFLYVNGELIKEAAATGFTTSGANEAGTDENGGYLIGNTFGLGGDPTVLGVLCDYNAVDLVIVDAKIYMGALTADEVATAYNAATAPYETTEEPVDPDPVDPKHEDLYVDINFAGNTATDAEGNVDFVVKGDASKVTTGEFTVKYGTKEVTVTGINIKSGAWVLGTFNKLADNTAVDTAVANAGGFTVEAFYANINPTGFVGIVCATEGNAASVNKAKQGWGLADNATAPYFITGNGAWCTTNPSGANITAGTLVHVVGVYDDAADKIFLYVNGELIKEAAATGFTTSGANEAGTDENGGYLIGNTFGLGGDPTVLGVLCDYNAVDLVIVDAKIYMGALTADEVATAYQAAIAPYAAE